MLNHRMQLQEMPDWVLYELYDALDCIKHCDAAVAQDIYKDIMRNNKDLVIDALQLIIIEVISDRR